jgi:hypothetical protein
MILHKPLTPKSSDGILRAIMPGRISTPQQDMKSIDARQFDAEKWLHQFFPGEIQIHRLAEQVSGLLAGRDTMVEAEELIATGRWDLVIATELREVYRNPECAWGVRLRMQGRGRPCHLHRR